MVEVLVWVAALVVASDVKEIADVAVVIVELEEGTCVVTGIAGNLGIFLPCVFLTLLLEDEANRDTCDEMANLERSTSLQRK